MFQLPLTESVPMRPKVFQKIDDILNCSFSYKFSKSEKKEHIYL